MPYIRGEKRSAIAITEPNAGSDIGAMEMRAERKKGKWVLNGTKIFISGAKQADFIITMAVTDPVKRQRGGITAFLVDRDTPGLTITRGIPTIGEHHPYEVHYDNVELSDNQVLGEVGNGFGPMQDRLNIRRIEIAQRCVGMAGTSCGYDGEVRTAAEDIWPIFGRPAGDSMVVGRFIHRHSCHPSDGLSCGLENGPRDGYSGKRHRC